MGVNWGSGSQEHVVTATLPEKTSPNNLFQLTTQYLPQNPDYQCAHGDVLRCGQTIRLRHTETNAFLRSQPHMAPLSRKSECSVENRGDKSYENFVIECYDPKTNKLSNGLNNGLIYKSTPIKLRNTKLNKYLYTAKMYEFNPMNCRGCPIQNQLEVSTHDAGADAHTMWTFGQGFYIPPATGRVIYDYADMGKEPKVLYDSKTDPAILAHQKRVAANGGHAHHHDEL